MNDNRVFAKCAWRLIPFMVLLYLVNYIDRVNVGFAALTMNRDLGFSPSVYGFGAGLFFLSYAICQVPAGIIVGRIGPRRATMYVLLLWGVISAANAFVWSPASFYALRFSLGVAEAGFFPAMILYLTLWFPKSWLARCIAMFQAANPLAVFVGAPLSGAILGLDGSLSFRGWQWLFLLEGVPACLLAFAVYRLLPDGPPEAAWLKQDEQTAISSRLNTEGIAARGDVGAALRDYRVYAIGFAAAGMMFCQAGIQLWAPQIVQSLGFSNLAVGSLLSLPAILAAMGMVAWGYSSDRYGERIWHFAFAALFTATGLIVAAVSGSYPGVFFGLTIAIIGQFAAMPISNSLAPAFLRGAGLASAVGLYNSFAQLGAFFGPLTMGILKQQTGGFEAGLFAFALAMVLAAVVALALGRAMAPRTRKVAVGA